MPTFDKKSVQQTLKIQSSTYTMYSLPKFGQSTGQDLSRLPFSIRILLESALRNYDNYQVTDKDIQTILNWKPNERKGEIAFKPDG